MLDTIKPNANAGSDFIINCANPSHFVTGTSTTPNVTFVWISSNNGVIGSTDTVTITASGTDTLIVTSQDNGCVGKDYIIGTTPIIVNPSLYISDTLICSGQKVTLMVNHGVNVTWNPGSINDSVAVVYPTTTTTYTVNGDDYNGCPGGISVTIYVEPNAVIKGSVWLKSGVKMNDGQVTLLRQSLMAAAYDSIAFVNLDTNGYFSFVPDSGNYIVRVKPNTSNPLYSNTVETYNDSVYMWMDAVQINHTCGVHNDSVSVHVIELPVVTGTAVISGTINGDTTYNGVRFGIGHNPGVFVTPIRGKNVKLGKSPSGDLLRMTQTDQNGFYAFNNLPFDSYTIYVDMPGYGIDSSYTVTTSPSNPTITTMDYFVDSSAVYIIDPLGVSTSLASKVKGLHVYPNPAKEVLTIEYAAAQKEDVTIKIFDLQGQLVHTLLNDVNAASTVIKLNLTKLNLNAGIYFIEAQSATQKHVQRIVIE